MVMGSYTGEHIFGRGKEAIYGISCDIKHIYLYFLFLGTATVNPSASISYSGCKFDKISSVINSMHL